MITEKDLLDAIAECEMDPITYNNIEKLANLYIVHDFLYGDRYQTAESEARQYPTESIIGKHGESEFLCAIQGKKAETVWSIIDELMDRTIKVINPRLYEGVMRRLDQ